MKHYYFCVASEKVWVVTPLRDIIIIIVLEQCNVGKSFAIFTANIRSDTVQVGKKSVQPICCKVAEIKKFYIF